MTIAPDTKDWTWVLDRPCPDCGFVAGEIDRTDLGEQIRANLPTWTAVLDLAETHRRPDPSTWSPLEYACHVRDVHRIFATRLRLMLEHDEPSFENWDQDQTALEERYAEQQPDVVAAEVEQAATLVADAYHAVPADAWGRRGLRSNGSIFTVETLGRYHLHDLVHHAHDVRAAVAEATRAAYDEAAGDYAAATDQPHDSSRAASVRFAAAVGPGGDVLEIGSGSGRDALLLEQAGLRVRRTDVTPGFVDLLRTTGHEADLLDPLHDDLGGPYDGIWANASLLHVARFDLPAVLGRLAEAARPRAVLRATLKEGDGEGWSIHGTVRRPRHFTYWRASALREVVASAGWVEVQIDQVVAENGTAWLEVWARRSS